MKKREKITRLVDVDAQVTAGVREWKKNPTWTRDEAIANGRNVANARTRRMAMGDRRHGDKQN